MDDKVRERYTRWQDYRIQHLGYCINLFLGFAVASVGFALSSDSRTLDPAPILWTASLIAGVAAVVSRLVDFRYTCKKIKSGDADYDLTTSLAGHITWISFGVQILTYCAGAALYVLAQ